MTPLAAPPDRPLEVRLRWRRPATVRLAVGVAALLMLLPVNQPLDWPSRWNPWAPLAVADPPNALTRFKLARLGSDPAACLTLLAQAGTRFSSAPDRDDGTGCRRRNAVRLTALPTRLSSPAVLSCPAAVALMLWERHSLQPLARQTFGLPVVRIDHFGSEACRNVAGTGRRSRHASADAIDIAGVVLADGRRLRIAADWRGDGPAAAFLHRLHAGACEVMDGVLGPDYDAAHADHLHLEHGPARVCR